MNRYGVTCFLALKYDQLPTQLNDSSLLIADSAAVTLAGHLISETAVRAMV